MAPPPSKAPKQGAHTHHTLAPAGRGARWPHPTPGRGRETRRTRTARCAARRAPRRRSEKRSDDGQRGRWVQRGRLQVGVAELASRFHPASCHVSATRRTHHPMPKNYPLTHTNTRNQQHKPCMALQLVYGHCAAAVLRCAVLLHSRPTLRVSMMSCTQKAAVGQRMVSMAQQDTKAPLRALRTRKPGPACTAHPHLPATHSRATAPSCPPATDLEGLEVLDAPSEHSFGLLRLPAAACCHHCTAAAAGAGHQRPRVAATLCRGRPARGPGLPLCRRRACAGRRGGCGQRRGRCRGRVAWRAVARRCHFAGQQRLVPDLAVLAQHQHLSRKHHRIIHLQEGGGPGGRSERMERKGGGSTWPAGLP